MTAAVVNERLLDRRILRYKDLVAVPVGDNGEPLVKMFDDPGCGLEIAQQEFPLVRASVWEKLRNAARGLKRRNTAYGLRVWCGYRSLSRQQNYFGMQMAVLAEKHPELAEVDLIEQVHLFVAVPEVAGHPTGGACDVTITCDGKCVDMAGEYPDFSSPYLHTFAENLPENQMGNRMLLREAMMDSGFAPFNGEWWHFSYGDREWAAFYGEKAAIYSQLDDPRMEDYC